MNKENGENENYVLDSTAFLALFEDEPGAETVQKLLERAKKGEIVIFASFVSFTEIFYITLRENGEEEAKDRAKLMNALAMTRVESSKELGLIAGRLKATKESLLQIHGLQQLRFFMMPFWYIKTLNLSKLKVSSKC